jgi:predicted nucleic acid-binding protein
VTRHVIDASAVAPLLFADEAARLSDDSRALIMDAALVAPRHWPFETANMVLMAQRRGRIDDAEKAICVSILRKLHVKLDEESEARAWSSSLELAQAQGLTLYDAAYLEVALRNGHGLLTFDTALTDAARARGIETPLLP